MTASKEKSNSLSGISVGLAFTALGLTYTFWLTRVYGNTTKYIAGGFILIGAVGLLIEAQKALTGSKIRIDNGGVGLLLLVPAAVGAYFVNNHLKGTGRGILISLLSLVALFGFAGLIDAFVSIIENNQGGMNIAKLGNLLRFLALLASSVATIIVAIKHIT